MATVEELLPFEPQAAWFRHNPHGIHGIGHETRVLILAELLAEAANVSSDERLVLRWAAITHDTQREDDGIDARHGERAAAWVLEKFTDPTIDWHRVGQLLTAHVPPDNGSLPLLAKLFKDADALDRVRLGDLDPRRLRTEHARALIPKAEALLGKAEGATFTETLLVAKELGLLS